MYGSSLADTPAHRDRVRQIVESRYAPRLYPRSSTGSVVVKVWSLDGRLHVLDAPLHELLSRRLTNELGAVSIDLVGPDAPEPRYAERWARVTDADLVETYAFDLLATEQLALFEAFRTRIAAKFLVGFFPMAGEERVLRLHAVEVPRPHPPPDSSRCSIYADLGLEVRGAEVDRARVPLCNLFAPREDGRVDEMRPVGRPFDEVLAGFEVAMERYLGKELPSTVRASKATKIAAFFRG